MRTRSKIENLRTALSRESRESYNLLFNFLCNVNRAAYKWRAEILPTTYRAGPAVPRPGGLLVSLWSHHRRRRPHGRCPRAAAGNSRRRTLLQLLQPHLWSRLWPRECRPLREALGLCRAGCGSSTASLLARLHDDRLEPREAQLAQARRQLLAQRGKPDGLRSGAAARVCRPPLVRAQIVIVVWQARIRAALALQRADSAIATPRREPESEE